MSEDTNGMTALSLAASYGHETMVRMFLECYADIESKDTFGQTALSWSAKNGHDAVVSLLLKKGADIESKDERGRTALEWAAGNGHEAGSSKTLWRLYGEALVGPGVGISSKGMSSDLS